jgi:hypothetical protein
VPVVAVAADELVVEQPLNELIFRKKNFPKDRIEVRGKRVKKGLIVVGNVDESDSSEIVFPEIAIHCGHTCAPPCPLAERTRHPLGTVLAGLRNRVDLIKRRRRACPV